MQLRPGQRVKMNTTLFDQDTDKYVRAVTLFDGIPVVTKDLVHIGYGHYRYEDDDVTVPENTEEVVIVYTVYTDDTYSEVDEDYEADNDIYSVVDVASQLSEQLNRIYDAITRMNINDNLIGYVDDDDVITGYVIIDELIGWIDETQEVVGVIVEDETNYPILDGDDNIEGSIE